MVHKVVHWEIMGGEEGALPRFYSELFGWSMQTPPGFPDYHMVDAGQSGVGGAVGSGDEQTPRRVTLYVEVDDATAHLAKAEAAGGTTVMPRTVLPGMVAMAMFADPAGNIVGLVEAEVPPA